VHGNAAIDPDEREHGELPPDVRKAVEERVTASDDQEEADEAWGILMSVAANERRLEDTLEYLGKIAPESPLIIKTAAEAYAIATQPVSKPAQMETNIAALLRSTSSLRNAIVLREIFGPPRSLQPLDLIGSV